MHHVGRHLATDGIIEGSGNAAIAAGAEAVAREVLSNPITTILWRMEKSGQAVRMVVGQYAGKIVGVAVADETLGSAVKNSIVTMRQLK